MVGIVRSAAADVRLRRRRHCRRSFDDDVLALLEAADDVLLVASMDIPSIKNLKIGMQTLDLLADRGPEAASSC